MEISLEDFSVFSKNLKNNFGLGLVDVQIPDDMLGVMQRIVIDNMVTKKHNDGYINNLSLGASVKVEMLVDSLSRNALKEIKLRK